MKFRFVLIAGSLGSFLVALIFNRIIYYTNKLRFPFFFPLFGITGYVMFYELNYWITGITYLINGIYIEGYDAILFLDISPHINPFSLRIFLITLFLVILIWLLVNLKKEIYRKIQIIKEKAKIYQID